MSAASADRNLLFGILAVQMDFISRDQLIAAMNAWVLDKGRPLGDLLQAQQALGKEEHALLEALVARHLQKHGNDPARSLAAVSSVGSVRDDIARIPDRDVHASLGHVAAGPRTGDVYATRAPSSVGSPSSAGQRFRILRPHARGGLGEVYVAHDEELHREVALKEIQDQHADHPESRTRFLVEAEITGALEHPGIVPVYGLGTYADGRPFYAMRFIRGDSLQEAVARFHRAEGPGRDAGERALALRGLLRRFIDVCHAIAYAHSRGVLHRDLKPGNVMLGQYGETLVVDWGLAKPLDRAEGLPPSVEAPLKPASLAGSTPTHVGKAVGTPQYMSPEQAAGRLDQLGPASDVYSLGATLYHLLTGRPPVEEPDVGAILNKVQRGDFPPPRQVSPGVPRALEAVCLKAMAPRPGDRYGSPKALADDVERWLADEPTTAWPEPWTLKARRWVGRHRTLVTGVAAAVLVAAVSLGVAAALLSAANERERQARREAEEQRDEAARRRAEAEQNYRLARQAVDRYHTEVSENVLLHEPGMQPLRQRLLEAAREFYQKFVERRRHDPEVRGELGKALFRLAQITGEIDSPQQGIALHEEAREVFAKLAAEHADDPEHRSDLAACLHHLGRLRRLTDQAAESRDAYDQALALWVKLREDHPEEERYRAEEARTRLGLGNVEQELRRLDRARDAYEKALVLRERLAADHPRVPEYRRDLAVSRQNLAEVLATAGEADKAVALCRQALGDAQGLVEDYPHIAQYQNDAARSEYDLGRLHERGGQPQAAAAAYQGALDRWARLADKHPAVLEYRARQATALTSLAGVRRALRQFEAAETACAAAMAIWRKLSAEHPKIPAYRAELAVCHRQLGDLHRSAGNADRARAAYDQALDMQETLAREHPALLEYQAEAARTANNLGLLEQEQQRPAPAEAAYRKALGLWEKLCQDRPDNGDYAEGLAVTRYNLGNLARDGGSAVAALDWYTQAVAALQGTQPAAARGTLRRVHERRAETLALLRRHAEALPDWDRALELADGKDRLWTRLHRTVAVARAGDHAQAAAEAAALAPLAGSNGEVLYQLARAFALSADAATRDARLPPSDQRRLADAHADKALGLLQRAEQAGYFKVAANRERLLKDPDLSVLRSREGFARLARS